MFQLHPGVLLPHRPVILSPCKSEEPVSRKLKRIAVEGRGYAITVVRQATSEPLVLSAREMVSPVKIRENCTKNKKPDALSRQFEALGAEEDKCPIIPSSRIVAPIRWGIETEVRSASGIQDLERVHQIVFLFPRR
ncbi:unnamed protein product [Merluccius merluccius]